MTETRAYSWQPDVKSIPADYYKNGWQNFLKKLNRKSGVPPIDGRRGITGNKNNHQEVFSAKKGGGI